MKSFTQAFQKKPRKAFHTANSRSCYELKLGGDYEIPQIFLSLYSLIRRMSCPLQSIGYKLTPSQAHNQIGKFRSVRSCVPAPLYLLKAPMRDVQRDSDGTPINSQYYEYEKLWHDLENGSKCHRWYSQWDPRESQPQPHGTLLSLRIHKWILVSHYYTIISLRKEQNGNLKIRLLIPLHFQSTAKCPNG